tara:strand:- start:694 stop:1176 length:483 start_codon:yes stop_codon:yes gene_type:complete
MKNLKYSIIKMSYQNPEERRILKACLIQWLVSPKILNYVSPKMKFPFAFSKWLNYYQDNSEIVTFVIKNNGWILGHLSLDFDNNNNAQLLHLIVDPKQRRIGLAKKLIKTAEIHGSRIGAKSISVLLASKNEKAKRLYEKLGYKKDGSRHSVLLKYSKIE